MTFSDLTSTFDGNLQAILQDELDVGIRNVEAKGGWAILADPLTGRILAYVQSQQYSRIMALQSQEPASVMKPLNYALCLKANEELIESGKDPVFYPDEWIESSDGKFPGRGAPLKDVQLLTWLNLNAALQKSANIHAARSMQTVIEVMGAEWYRMALKEVFGFGKAYFSDEHPGFIPTPGKKYSNGSLEWSKATPHVLGLGYNLLVNSLQLLRAYTVLASNGLQLGQQNVLSASICQRTIDAMKFVTQDGGTSRLGNIPLYTEACKSGTAEKFIDGAYSKTKNRATFIGFSPAMGPKMMLLVTVDEPVCKNTPDGLQQFGGVSAAPIFRDIAKRVLAYLGVEPDDPHCGTENGDLWCESQELKAMYLKLNS